VPATTSSPQRETGGAPRRRRGYLVAAAVLIAGAVFAVLVGAHTDPQKVSGPVDTSHLADNGPAPVLHPDGWLNSPPITQSDLHGKVVLYDFWTYSCINCVRTFPYIRSWFDRYQSAGLVVVGIHSPEFDFEHVHSNVEADTSLAQGAGRRTWVLLTREWGEDPSHFLRHRMLERQPDALKVRFAGVDVFELEP